MDWRRVAIVAAASVANTPLVYAADAASRLATGRPTRLLDLSRVSFRDTANRRPVEARLFAPDARLAVLFALGQSNLANEGDAGALFEPGSAVYNFNFFDGRIYRARDPLLGAYWNRSNLLTRLGDRLVRSGAYDRVLLVPVAAGGTACADWVPGGKVFPRAAVALTRLRARGIVVTHALWQQGEAESAEKAPDGATWMRHFRTMVAALRRAGMAAPLYVAQSTRCHHPPNATIRAAQEGVIEPAARILAGPDTDTIGPEHRWDGCHFSGEGLDRAAGLWFESIAGR